MHQPRLPLISTALAAVLGLGACNSDRSLTGPMAAEPAALAERRIDIGNPISNSWGTRPDMPTARTGLVAATVNGVIYAIGGRTASQPTLAKVEAYDHDASLIAWSDRASLPAARSYSSGAAVINGKIYVTGGFNMNGEPTRSLFVYNVATGSWSTKARIPVVSIGGASAAINGKLYVLSGPRPGDPPHSKLHRYDPATNSWVSRAAPSANLTGAVVGVIDGKLYVAGGEGSSEVLSTLHVYDPSADAWLQSKANMPEGRVAAAGRVLNGKLYVVGGRGPGAPGLTQVYNPVTNSWATKAPMLTPRFSAAAATAGGLLYVLGGVEGLSYANTNEVYIP